jgi:Ni,Fe-hydrogenase III component G
MAVLDPVRKIKDKFGSRIIEVLEKSPRRAYVMVKKEDAFEAVRFLFDDLKARFIIISALDTTPGIEMLYHFSFDTIDKVVSIRTIIPMPSPEIESISLMIPGAEYVEREIFDILGVNFINHPNLRRFILGDDWPEGDYPYRREHKGQFPYRTEEERDLYRQKIREEWNK